jgi:hypothetical protein
VQVAEDSVTQNAEDLKDRWLWSFLRLGRRHSLCQPASTQHSAANSWVLQSRQCYKQRSPVIQRLAKPQIIWWMYAAQGFLLSMEIWPLAENAVVLQAKNVGALALKAVKVKDEAIRGV